MPVFGDFPWAQCCPWWCFFKPWDGTRFQNWDNLAMMGLPHCCTKIDNTHTHMAMVTAWYRRIVSQPSSFFGVSENRVQKKNISDYHLPHLPSKLLKLWGSSGRPPFWKPGKTRSQARPLTWSAGQESSLKVLQLDSVDISNSWVYQLVNHSGVSKHVKMDHNYVCQFWCIIIQQYNHMYIYSHWL